MGILPEGVKERLGKDLEEAMVNEVKLVMFTQEVECQFCKETRELLEEVATLSPKIKLEVYDFIKDGEKAKDYQIDKIPAIAVIGKKDYGIRFYGIPSGYEVTALVQDIIDVSKGVTKLSEENRNSLKTVNKPIHIQVFVLPTCPYCPGMGRLAHQFAMESEFIKADIIEASEFPQLTHKYAIMAVPKTIINEKVEVLGAVTEEVLVERVLQALHSSADISPIV
jgi:glutaredoxin-like protein